MRRINFGTPETNMLVREINAWRGGLLLLRHVTPLTRRYVVHFCSGAYNRGQITGFATFANFIGMAIGALAFHRLMVPRFSTALVCFECTEFRVGVLALYAFRAEAPALG
jgi:hypothetical protein